LAQVAAARERAAKRRDATAALAEGAASREAGPGLIDDLGRIRTSFVAECLLQEEAKDVRDPSAFDDPNAV
jgi:hypothetical protein